MRVHLRLQRSQLHAGRDLGLALELKACQLRGDKVRKARCQRGLAHVDVAEARVVELQRAHAAVAHRKRRHDARAQTGEELALPRVVSVAREHAHHLGRNHVERGIQHHGLAGGIALAPLAPACQHLLAVGDAHGGRQRLRQDDLTGAHGGVRRHALARMDKDLGRDAKGAVRCARGKVIGNHEHVAKEEAQHNQAGDGNNRGYRARVCHKIPNKENQ